MAKIAVIGAGVGGLAAAIRFANAGHQVEVFEANAHPGGNKFSSPRPFSLGYGTFGFHRYSLHQSIIRTLWKRLLYLSL